MQLNTLSNEEKIVSLKKDKSSHTMNGFITHQDYFNSLALT